MIRIRLVSIAFMAAILSYNGQVVAGSLLKNCYDIPGVMEPEVKVKKTLYVFIDQTMALTMPMKNSLIQLISKWGHQGENIKITRFSANIQGNYTELVFDETGNVKPTEPYLFHLRRKHKKQILACLEKHKNDFHDALANTLSNTLKLTDDKLPKTNLIHSLNTFSEQLINDKAVKDKTVLIISDGLEHSDLFSFHQAGVVRGIDTKKMLNIVRRKHLIPNWYNAKIYFFGLGYISDEKFYARPKILKPLVSFWSKFFAEGGGRLNSNSMGTPMLLTKSIL